MPDLGRVVAAVVVEELLVGLLVCFMKDAGCASASKRASRSLSLCCEESLVGCVRCVPLDALQLGGALAVEAGVASDRSELRLLYEVQAEGGGELDGGRIRVALGMEFLAISAGAVQRGAGRREGGGRFRVATYHRRLFEEQHESRGGGRRGNGRGCECWRCVARSGGSGLRWVRSRDGWRCGERHGEWREGEADGAAMIGRRVIRVIRRAAQRRYSPVKAAVRCYNAALRRGSPSSASVKGVA